MKQQIALGTAQFGLEYGITNRDGRVEGGEAARMLASAWEGGVRLLDTAPAYGDSEKTLGRAFATAPERGWRVVTKTAPLRTTRIGPAQVATVDAAFRASLGDLGMPAVDTLLVHHADDLLADGGAELYHWLRTQQAEGRATRIGVSIYDAQQAEQLLERFALDAVQLPASIADQRLLVDGTVDRLHAAGVEIHVRSLYLQGLLLAEPAFVAARFPAQAEWARRFQAECRRRAVDALQACLSFFRSQPALRVAVLGAASEAQVRAMVAAWNTSDPMDWSGWAVENPAFTDPRQWSKP